MDELTPEAWRAAPEKAIAFIGMSGVGKTRLAQILRDSGDWFHYSVDYRIGTRYLGEAIVDDFRREAMKSAVLRQLLRTDSIRIESKLSFHNLTPLSTWLGKPGDSARGGMPFEEYLRRQRMHREAEVAAMLDAAAFMRRARTLYDYANFVCDTSGSICEVIDPDDPEDAVMTRVAATMLPVYIRGSEAHEAALKARFDRSPKPMYYREDFLKTCWADYLAEKGVAEDQVDPDDFIRWGFAALLESRLPRYQRMADRWGVTIQAADVERVITADEILDLIAEAIGRRAGS